MRTHKSYSEIGAACAAVLRNRKTGRALAHSLEDLSFALNSNVDKGTEEVYDMVALPLSMVLRAATGEDNWDGPQLAVQREGATLAAMDCLLAMARMVRQGLKDKTTSSVAAEKQVSQILHWLSHFLQDYRKHPEEASLKASEVAIFCYGRVLPLAFPARGGGEDAGPFTRSVPTAGCHVAFALDQSAEVAGRGSRGSKAVVRELLAATEAMAAYLAADLDVLAFFLPGIASKVSALLLLAAGKGQTAAGGGARQCVTGPMASSGCVCGALSCLGTVLISCFRGEGGSEDDGESRGEAHLRKLREMAAQAAAGVAPEGGEGEVEEVAEEETVAEAGPKGQFLVRRDSRWVKESCSRVEGLLASFLPDLCGHDSPSVRRSVLSLVSQAMGSCPPLERSRPFLECLLALAHDSDSEISDKASNLVYAYGERHRCKGGERWELLETADGLFEEYASRLVPAAKHTSSLPLLAKKLSSLLCLGRGGYLAHLHSNRRDLLTKFLDSLRQCFSFDVIKATEATGPLIWVKGETMAVAAAVLPRMQPNFAFLHTPQDYRAAAMICAALAASSLLAQASDRVPVFDFVVRHCTSCLELPDAASHAWCLRAMSSCAMAAEVVASCGGEEGSMAGHGTHGAPEAVQERRRESLRSAIALLVEELTQEGLWAEISTMGAHAGASRCSQLACVSLESLGAFAAALGRDFADRYDFLPQALFILLDRLGDEMDPRSARSADLALRCVCHHCGHESVSSLLYDNSDYLVDGLVLRLMHLDLHPSAPRMLAAVVKIARGAGEGNFLDFVALVREPFAMIASNMSVYARHLHGRHAQAHVSILSLLAEVCQLGSLELSPGRAVLADQTDDRPPLTAEEEGRREEAVAFIVETSSLVATQASELLHAWERLRWDLLDAIDHSVSALAACQDLPRRGRAKKEGEAEQGGLLPTIATAWPQLMRASEGRARGRCLRTAARLACCGGKFATSRVTKDLWPALNSMIAGGDDAGRCEALVALTEVCASETGRLALSHRTSLRCARSLASLCRDLDRRAAKNTPPPLVDALARSLNALKEADPDAVLGMLLDPETKPLSQTSSPRRARLASPSVVF